jgi:hypothetical protein
MNNIQTQINLIGHPETVNILQYINHKKVPGDTKRYGEQWVNILTVISETDKDFFFFLFYYLLRDSLKTSFRNMEAITDLFLYLQKKKRFGKKNI